MFPTEGNRSKPERNRLIRLTHFEQGYKLNEIAQIVGIHTQQSEKSSTDKFFPTSSHLIEGIEGGLISRSCGGFLNSENPGENSFLSATCKFVCGDLPQ